MQRHRDAEVRGRRGLGMQRFGDAKVWGCKGLGMQRHRDAEVWPCELTRLLQSAKRFYMEYKNAFTC